MFFNTSWDVQQVEVPVGTRRECYFDLFSEVLFSYWGQRVFQTIFEEKYSNHLGNERYKCD